MSALLGTNIAAQIVPFTTEDSYPTHRALYGHGGWRSVQTIEERDALPLGRLEPGTVVWVVATLQAFIRVNDAWQDFGLAMPDYATTETLSCFFPASPTLGTKLIWTAGIDVNFGDELEGFGNILQNPTVGGVVFNITNKANETVGSITISAEGVFTFSLITSEELIVPKGDYLVFIVATANQDASDISFTVTGKRTLLPA